MRQTKLNKAIYHQLRDQFSLKSQMAQSAIRNVVGKYRTVKTQLAQRPYRFDTGKKDQNGKAIWDSVPKTLDWLWQPIKFNRPQLDLQRDRDWTVKKDQIGRAHV